MANLPLITFKAGLCDLDSTAIPPVVKPRATPGFIYLYSEDELLHFCWRPRTAPLDEPQLDLVMIPTDAQFKPYKPRHGPEDGHVHSPPRSPTDGRLAVLKFMGSSDRKLFWLQSAPQSKKGDPAWFSPRDLKLISLVDDLLQGSEPDMPEAIQQIQNANDGPDGDDDETMEDIEGTGHGSEPNPGSGGGAGPAATGGDIREEGEQSREGGADGGRAASMASNDPATVVQNFLNSLKGSQSLGRAQQQQTKSFTTLPDLLPTSTTVPVIESADDAYVDSLLSFLPPTLILLTQDIDDVSSLDPSSDTAKAVMETLSLDEKKDILRRVLRSPQFNQSLGSLTSAIQDGGLPTISEALKIEVENGGLMKRGSMPIGGGDAVKAFLEGVKRVVEEEEKAGKESSMDTD